MSQSLAKLFVHAIFSTKDRVPCLSPEVRPQLYLFMSTILDELRCPAVQIGGAADHMHVLCALDKSTSAEEMLRGLKASSSRWIKTKDVALHDFHWQAGYGIFSVSVSNLDKVRRYVQDQEEHHKKVSFQDELRLFFDRYQVEYDERYVWG